MPEPRVRKRPFYLLKKMMGIFFSIWQVFRIHVGGRVPPSSSQENSAKNSFLVHFCPFIHFYRFWFFSWLFCSLLTLVNVKPLFSAFLGKVFPKKLSRLFVEGGGVGAPSPILYYIIYGQWTQKTPKPLYGFGILAFFANKWLWWDANHSGDVFQWRAKKTLQKTALQ